MKHTKAMTTSALSWMIITIIGTFFIVFAYNLISDYQTIETQKFEIELETALNHIFTLIGQSTGSESTSLQKVNTIFENRRVEMFCREGIPTLSIDGRENPNAQYLRNYPVFMTEIEQRRNDLSYVAVQNFNLPFRITSLLAIVSKQNYYIIDSSSPEIYELYREKFNEYSSFNELTVKFIDFSSQNEINQLLSEVKEESVNSISFVSDESYSSSHFSNFFNEIDFYGTYIQVNNKEFSIEEQTHYKGTINYVDSTNPEFNSAKFSYIDWNEEFALPTMALMSKPETFKCSYQLLQEAINETYLFYQIKAGNIEQYSKKEQHCVQGISKAEQALKYSKINQTLNTARTDENFINFENGEILEQIVRDHRSIIENSCIYLY